MDRRDVLGMLGAFGAGCVMPDQVRADHGEKRDGATPVSSLHAHFCGIHIAKTNPRFQLIVQHHCAAHRDDLFQCILFDSPDKNARLLGVEYIISDERYRKLSETEKKYWHPHTYEVLAGGLIAPGMPADKETAFMKSILTTWGKTWHTWPDPRQALPVGEPLLMWAVTGDGQLDDKVVAARDRQFNVSCETIRDRRTKEIGFEVPQVSLPKSIDDVGRQWTNEGDDQPMRKSGP